ncbi:MULTISPECIES: DUF6223 family protein [unclassified Amycolatopsis]|uniref:DUF6223 family protein n=1 Tax=unclassified Amycolatopsis TaxID=2618356 RepID=UPI0028741ACC|nr:MULTISPECIES: DUF6223 family protein [unclassified Amycolatopsis]MDS0135167.1 hypothetical protein [Amycolatopsis sp. 505]MDS0143056.1 hypothetical protein [Amycolatopsis sp. CM201R]
MNVLAAASAYDLTPGRLWSLIAVVFGVAGVVAGVLALRRGRGAVAALASGVVSVVIGGWVVATAKGGPGTGYGIVGGYVDLVIGAVALVLGGLAVARSRGFVGGRR